MIHNRDALSGATAILVNALRTFPFQTGLVLSLLNLDRYPLALTDR